jgi:hypothetical protein
LAFDVHGFERGGNDLAGLGWREFMFVLGPFCMAHSLVMAGEKRFVRHTKGQEPEPVVCIL